MIQNLSQQIRVLPMSTSEFLHRLLFNFNTLAPAETNKPSGSRPAPDAGLTPAKPPALLSMKLIRQFYVPVGDRTLDQWISSGRFPKADLRIGNKVRLWKRETVEDWCNEQSSARFAKPSRLTA